jgi:hypothetical protein
VFLAASAAACSAQAAIVKLDFEGIGNMAFVNDFYNGGTDSQGHSGVDYGVSFSATTLGLIDSDAGGFGAIANEPSPSTVIFFQNAFDLVLNVPAGFDTGFSFSYATMNPARVRVFDEVGATGNLLATLDLAAVGVGTNCGDPNGFLCIWTPIDVSFSGTAKSVAIIAVVGQPGGLVVDDISFSSDAPVVSVPEPSTYAMMALGLAGLAARSRRRPCP